MWFLIILLELQAEECLKREKDRVSHYLHSSSESKLLEVCSFSWQTLYECAFILGTYSRDWVMFIMQNILFSHYFSFSRLTSKIYLIVVFWPFSRKSNMSCCPFMQPNCLRRSTPDVMRCLGTTRYHLDCTIVQAILLSSIIKINWCIIYLVLIFCRWRICLGCIGSFLKYLKA